LIRLQASVQSLVFVIMLAATLFGTVGRFDIIEFWVYIAIVAAVSHCRLSFSIPILCRSGCGRAVVAWADIFCR
jgi:hypothetical protein